MVHFAQVIRVEIIQLEYCFVIWTLLARVLPRQGHGLRLLPPGVHQDFVEVEEASVVKHPATLATLHLTSLYHATISWGFYWSCWFFVWGGF